MGGRDHPGGLAEPLVKRLKIGGHAVHVGKAVQVDQRLAVARFR